MASFKLSTHNYVIRLEDNTFIPLVEDNVDYQQYLKWLAAGNTPAPADPAPIPPIVVSAWQIRKALNQLNLRDAVEAAITASTDINLKDAWQYATEFDRSNPLVESLGTALSKTPEEVDEIFELAKTL